MNSSQLAVINDEPNSYFDTAARMWLNGSLTSLVGQQIAAAPLLTVNGKPAVVYLGAISCVYCGENRWAMALALSRFGIFQNLFFGYSSLGDQDVPTVYWAPAHYNATSAVDFGNFYRWDLCHVSLDRLRLADNRGIPDADSALLPTAGDRNQQHGLREGDEPAGHPEQLRGDALHDLGSIQRPGADASDFGDVTSTSTSTASSTSASSTTSTTSTARCSPSRR